MTGKRLLAHSIFLFLLPLVVAWFGISVSGAIVLVLAALAWRWVISLSVFVAPVKVPELELETIAASHFVEKVRWCMDRLGLDYTERQTVGALGAFFLGRTVPRLKIRTGSVRSTIGNSPEILAICGDHTPLPSVTRQNFWSRRKIDLLWNGKLIGMVSICRSGFIFTYSMTAP